MLATHRNTLEFTKDKNLTLKGDCIVGINADFDIVELKNFIKNCSSKKITITIEADGKVKEKITAEINPNFDDWHEIVIRKTDFISKRTFAVKADKAAIDIDRKLADFLRKESNKITVILESFKE